MPLIHYLYNLYICTFKGAEDIIEKYPVKIEQDDYYRVLNIANAEGESTVFVEFMLLVIRDMLKELAANEAAVDNDLYSIEDKLISLLKKDEGHSARSLSSELGISERQVQRIIKDLREAGVIERVGANRSGKWIVK